MWELNDVVLWIETRPFEDWRAPEDRAAAMARFPGLDTLTYYNAVRRAESRHDTWLALQHAEPGQRLRDLLPRRSLTGPVCRVRVWYRLNFNAGPFGDAETFEGAMDVQVDVETTVANMRAAIDEAVGERSDEYNADGSDWGLLPGTECADVWQV